MSAAGNFEVQLTPQMEDDIDAGRLLIDKKYSGDMQGEGKGQMLSARTAIDGSAGYVAIEHFSGEIGGSRGSFTLLHKGIMDRGEDSLDISVIPDSGTEEFVGLTGTMQIDIVDGEHRYHFDYQIIQN